MSNICMLGAGAWGTAVAQLLAENGHTVRLWCREPEVAELIQKTRINARYLPCVVLHNNIRPVDSFDCAFDEAEFIFEAVPVAYLRGLLEQIKPYSSPSQTWVMLSKGIEQNSLLLPTQIIDSVFGYEAKKAVLAGPSFAADLAQKQITAVTIAASTCKIGEQVQLLLANEYFRPYISLDCIGVQTGAALKNVITLCVGILDGAGYKDNVKAFVLTRGLNEIAQLAVMLGGKQETVYGLSGVGDLVLTAMGNLSKNLAVGRRLGQGQTLDFIQKEIGTLPEGVNTVQAMHQLALKSNLDLPICAGVYEIIYQGKSVDQFLASLMARPLERECL